MGFIGGLGFAALFYFAAEYEHMTGWKWALASLAVYATVDKLFLFSFVFQLPAQFGLFLLLWWANTRRKAELEAERTARAQEDQRRRQERARQAREQGPPPDVAARQAASDAREEAALRERQERVRRAREAREREEREQAERDKQGGV